VRYEQLTLQLPFGIDHTSGVAPSDLQRKKLDRDLAGISLFFFFRLEGAAQRQMERFGFQRDSQQRRLTCSTDPFRPRWNADTLNIRTAAHA
jgi:hypothetical protein